MYVCDIEFLNIEPEVFWQGSECLSVCAYVEVKTEGKKDGSPGGRACPAACVLWMDGAVAAYFCVSGKGGVRVICRRLFCLYSGMCVRGKGSSRCMMMNCVLLLSLALTTTLQCSTIAFRWTPLY